ncbi:hypothetical protein P3342_012564 [Pyrenophora teres f. teres]|nr:hypothetical protein P3342_012564 [Pyrenophora teres f. teres]
MLNPKEAVKEFTPEVEFDLAAAKASQEAAQATTSSSTDNSLQASNVECSSQGLRPEACSETTSAWINANQE